MEKRTSRGFKITLAKMWTLTYWLTLLSLLDTSNPAVVSHCCKCEKRGDTLPFTVASYEQAKRSLISKAYLFPISYCCPQQEIMIEFVVTIGHGHKVRCVKMNQALWKAILKYQPSSLQPVPNNLSGPPVIAISKRGGPPINPWAGNSWVTLLRDSAPALTNHSCILCALTPTSSEEGVPFVPIPLNKTGILSDWGFDRQFNFSGRYDGSERLRVIKSRGSVCISQKGGGFKVGESKCQDTWTSAQAAPREGPWKCSSASFNTHKNCACLWALFNYNFRYSIRGKHTFVWRNCSVSLLKGTQRGSLTLDLMSSRSSITNKACGLRWICGQWAYRQLPSNWTGTCYLGALIPGVWMTQSTAAGIKTIPPNTYRAKRSIDNSFENIAKGGSQKWGDDEWPAERIIKYYGPATWEPNVVGREPTYLTNLIVRLQAVVEIVTNKTAAALRLIGDQLTQLCTTVLQNRLALDYILASEGRVCKKLNLSDCCVEIDDNGELIKALADDMEKVAHVPVQKWNGWRFDWFLNWFPQLGWLKGGIMAFCLLISGLCLLPCILPCMMSIVKQTARSVANHEMLICYQTLALTEDS
ncbi:uncharacterized protein LOC132244850 [Alligator mississippiensis]|uniref:uncharacterized protein LOC132244850 n=1 Tax=Alligator mississippiensis TaxID=8496 RepID=UPI00287796C0|nr:uncharacterized protein LOC132244850 [Alligator mississippiensis]XP_059573450.1 uncharacterized protein LOC132244850 [Alligator mississippiensis]XP_059573456.1 uncharacterized protein LOC132244850 [Alligator mississippiensis]XP_059573464.1 uncharacterized protein LOC132244850 [Alligator mississippiensis]